MIKCKICEKEVSDEKLGPHSQKCREVFECKELLRTIMRSMEAHLDKASSMKNSLETNATKQQNKRHTKKNSFKDLLDLTAVGRIKSTNSNGSQNGMSPAVTKHTNDTDFSNSEDDKTDRMMSTRETLEIQDDSARVMSDTDYRKFVEEVKKSMSVLKKVMLYAKSIAEWALELSPVCEVGTATRNELEQDIKEIVDENVLEFLKAFMVDIESYILVREKYLDATHELVRVNSPKSHASIRQKLNMKRSTSFAVKADSAAAGQFLTAKKIDDSKKKESPSTEKRKLPAGAASIQIGLGSPLSRRSSKVGDFGQATSSVMASPSMKSISNKALFQTNVNHMAGLSSFASMAGLRKNTEDASSLRDKIKTTLNQNNLDKSNGSIESGMMSPSMSALKRDPQTNRIKGRMPLASNNTTLSAFAKGKVDQKVVLEQPGTPTKRTSSHNSWFKNIRNEDTSVLNKFPVANKEEPTSPKSKITAPIFTVNAPAKSGKKTENRDFMDLKGYYSDCQASRSRRTVTKSDSHHQDVGFEDFELVKFIGKGAYGNVYLVKKKATGDHYAMKTVDWADRGTQNRMKAIKAEKDIYQALEGDFVVKAFWTFHYENLICFVTEYMLGGDFNKILDRLARLDEEQAQFYFSEIVLAVESLHKLKVVHRDLKPDNILMDAKGHIRLTDFGLSQKGMNRLKINATPGRKGSMSPGGLDDPATKARINLMSKLGKDLTRDASKGRVDFKERGGHNKKSTKAEKIFNFLGKEEYHKVIEKKPFLNKKHKDSPQLGHGDKKPKMVGTPDYMAPEIIAPEKYDIEGYDEKCMDWWSMGCILYQFLVGITPFCDNSIEAVFDNISNLRMDWPPIGDDEDCISHAAADLIKQLLNPDPKKRLGAKGAEEVKKHPFFKGIDWATLREREAPMIPCSMEDLDIGQAEPEEPSSPLQGFAITPSKTCKPFDFGAFQMRRLDLLDQANQKTHQELVRQKSCKIQL